MGLLRDLQQEASKRAAEGDRRDLVIHNDDVDLLVADYIKTGGFATAHLKHKDVADKVRANQMKVLGFALVVTNAPKPPPPPPKEFRPRAVRRTL